MEKKVLIKATLLNESKEKNDDTPYLVRVPYLGSAWVPRHLVVEENKMKVSKG